MQIWELSHKNGNYSLQGHIFNQKRVVEIVQKQISSRQKWKPAENCQELPEDQDKVASLLAKEEGL